jgi:hypothetical protein
MIVPDEGKSLGQIVVAVSGRRNLRPVHVNIPFECAYTYLDHHSLRKGWIRLLEYSKTRLPVHKVQLDRRNMCPCQDISKPKIHIHGGFSMTKVVLSVNASIHVIVMLSCDCDRRVN